MVGDWAIPQRRILHVNITLNVLMLLTQSLHVAIKIICAQVLSKDCAQALGFLAFGPQPLGLFHAKGLLWVPSGAVKSQGNLHLFYVEMVPHFHLCSIWDGGRWCQFHLEVWNFSILPACCSREQGLPSKGTDANKSKQSYGELFRHSHS